ncbi:uncharacterized protein LOC129741361 [Uranotaenia lowii]|uniref:uncharacterized protein LOC129741361 n=1 Tax=Uranotaenia lowii TaxID=190385 RepID=UPI002478F8FA|nr:uncharacterized protein LOC129741361 [Uranotaenia lowii]
MQLNIKKCKSITFSRRQSNVCFEYSINGTSIDQVSSMNGVIVDKKLTFSDHISAITAKAFSVLGFVRRNSQSFQDVYTLKAVYCSFVRSVLEYAACVLSPHHTSWSLRIERVQVTSVERPHQSSGL